MKVREKKKNEIIERQASENCCEVKKKKDREKRKGKRVGKRVGEREIEESVSE